MPDNFRFYDPPAQGNPRRQHGAKLKDLMVRAGQSSERAQLVYQQSGPRSCRPRPARHAARWTGQAA
ncbi:hypothetical protein GCM10010270_35020 [Streptomyces violaceus]|nr:hypothetical protein GCM10010270_35020 [Streptomyces janthinus]